MAIAPACPSAERIAAALALIWLVGLAGLPASANQGLVARDGTLGSGALDVATGLDPLGQPADYLITPDLGEQHGANLFHSFARFGIGVGETATFTGPDPIGGPQSVANIISRVTGGAASQLDGTLRSTIPGADLWLINPSGIVFGAGAQLDVPGSFHAATADSLAFDDAGLVRFYADASRPSVLAIAEPRMFGFFESVPSATPSLRVDGSTLTVRAGETLSLVARDGLALDHAQLTAENGRVNLAAVAGAGDVALAPATAAEPLDVSSFAALGDVALTQQSLVDASGTAPGAIFIRGGRVGVEGSRVLARNHGASAPGGSVGVIASELLDVNGGLLSVSTDSAGAAGTIRLTGGDLRFRGGGPGIVDLSLPPDDLVNFPHEPLVGLAADTLAGGGGGALQIDARSLEVVDGATLSASTVGADATGHAGTILIAADSVYVGGRAFIVADAWWSQGDAGGIALHADTLTLDGADGYAYIDAAIENFSSPFGEVPGAPGSIEITAGSIALLNGGAIDLGCYNCTSTKERRSPDAATIRILAGAIRISGVGSGIDAGADRDLLRVGVPSTGDAGTIAIDAGSVQISAGGFISASTRGPGDAGTVAIDAGSLVLENEAQILANAHLGSTGDAGTITVDADSVRIRKDAFIGASSFGPGNAGTIDVRARQFILVDHEDGPRFSLRDVFADKPGLTGIFTSTLGEGSGGTVTLDAPDITITNGALVGTTSIGGGDAGDVFLRGGRIQIVDGGGVDSTSIPNPFTLQSGGSAGSVTLEAAESIEVVGRHPVFGDVSRITSASLGSGAGGDVLLRAPRILVDGGLLATTALPFVDGQQGLAGGAIRFEAEDVSVRGGGRVDASTFIAGPGGSIDIDASGRIVVEGAGSEISARSSSDPEEARELFASLFDGGLIGAPSALVGNAGDIRLRANEVRLTGAAIATSAETADGGDIAIEARRLVRLSDGSSISASVGGGAGGSVTIDPVLVLLEDSAITANAAQGTGGRIAIAADLFFARGASLLDASAGDPAFDGIVEIHSPDVDLSAALAALPASFLDAAALMRERCAARRTGARAGSFTVRSVGGVPAQPDGPLAATPLRFAVQAETPVATDAAASLAPLDAQRLASRASCD